MTHTLTTTRFVALLTIAAIGALSLLAIPASTHAQSARITNQLDIGSTGGDVTRVQMLLSTNRDIYPEARVTGYYGPLTAKAVARFQLYYGLPTVGRVGPQTAARMNAILAMSTPVVDIYAPIITDVDVEPNTQSSVVEWKTNESTRSKVFFSTSPLSVLETSMPMTEPQISGTVDQDQLFRTTHTASLSNLDSNRTYYYTIVSADATGNVSITTPALFNTDR